MSQSHLFQLIAAYLGQDMDLWASSEEEAIQLFAQESGPVEVRGALADIAALRAAKTDAIREFSWPTTAAISTPAHPTRMCWPFWTKWKRRCAIQSRGPRA